MIKFTFKGIKEPFIFRAFWRVLKRKLSRALKFLDFKIIFTFTCPEFKVQAKAIYKDVFKLQTDS